MSKSPISVRIGGVPIPFRWFDGDLYNEPYYGTTFWSSCPMRIYPPDPRFADGWKASFPLGGSWEYARSGYGETPQEAVDKLCKLYYPTNAFRELVGDVESLEEWRAYRALQMADLDGVLSLVKEGKSQDTSMHPLLRE